MQVTEAYKLVSTFVGIGTVFPLIDYTWKGCNRHSPSYIYLEKYRMYAPCPRSCTKSQICARNKFYEPKTSRCHFPLCFEGL